MKWKAVAYEVLRTVGRDCFLTPAPPLYNMPSHDTKQFAVSYNAFLVNIVAAQKAFDQSYLQAMMDPAQAKCYLLRSRTFKSSSSRLVNFIQDFISSSQYRIRSSEGSVLVLCLEGITT